ncbi:MAG: NAD(P)-dependent oxidoreductase [Candidatus Edwardsbacteria bacterium]|jgi:nucleoside-diphosphate-sugar epimerase|nr:NAD(P)-dependent oxidoreductase [Candidatus Edwardsbacteria bacterium]
MNIDRRYLVTGGSGFIGGHLIADLLRDPGTAKVVNLDLRPYPGAPDPRLETVIADIRRPLEVDLPGGTGTCFHLAAVCREPGHERQEYFATNHIGTRNVIDLCRRRGIRSIVFTSTIMVYPPGDRPCDESAEPRPDTAYGESKLLAERELERWAAEGNRLRIVRPGVVFGPGDYGNFIRLHRALQYNLFCFVGRRTTIKGSVYVRDVASCLRFMETPAAKSAVYNCVFPARYDVGQIVDTICDAEGWRRWVPVLPYRPMRWLAKIGPLLEKAGLRNGLHPRRIDKLYRSTDAVPQALSGDGFSFRYDLRAAVAEWLAGGVPSRVQGEG